MLVLIADASSLSKLTRLILLQRLAAQFLGEVAGSDQQGWSQVQGIAEDAPARVEAAMEAALQVFPPG